MLFIAGQLFVLLVHGIVISPFYNYGMFSEVMKPKEEYWAFEVNVNGQNLRGKDFSASEWDKIMLPLNYYSSISAASNRLFYTDVRRIMNTVFLHPNEKRFLQNCNEEDFIEWYKKYLSVSFDKTINTLHIQYRKYRFEGEKLQPADVVYPLSQLCP
jgi:capsule polysaccharide export protein KpsE/RkpR